MSTPDPLAGLRDQIRTLTDAAERLVHDVEAAARDGHAWESPPERASGELAGLVRLLELLGEILPADVRAPLIDLIRELLVLARALLDWAVARLEAPARGREAEVEDIPIL